MEISFTTKAKSKAMQEREFLALSPSERFLVFIKISQESLKLFPKTDSLQSEKNFILEMKYKC